MAFLDESSSRTGKFARAYFAEYGYPPENAFSALGYDTVYLLAEVIGRAGLDDPEVILEALEDTTGFKGVTGEISYQRASLLFDLPGEKAGPARIFGRCAGGE